MSIYEVGGFLQGTPVSSSINKADRLYIAKILLKVVLITITLKDFVLVMVYKQYGQQHEVSDL